MAELDRMFHLADEVIRHKVIRLPEKVAGTVPRPSPSQEGEASERAPRSDET
jgi:ribosomal protein S6